MRGASRASYAELRDRLGGVAVGPATSEQIGDQLFAVVRLIDSEHGLRRALADASKPAAEKTAVVRRLLHGRVSEATEELVAEAAAARVLGAREVVEQPRQLGREAFRVHGAAGISSSWGTGTSRCRIRRSVAATPATATPKPTQKPLT